MKLILITILAVGMISCESPNTIDSEIENPTHIKRFNAVEKALTQIPLTQIELPTENEKAALINKKITVFGNRIFQDHYKNLVEMDYLQSPLKLILHPIL